MTNTTTITTPSRRAVRRALRRGAPAIAALLTMAYLGIDDSVATQARPADRPPLPRTEPSGPAVDHQRSELPADWEPQLWTDLPPRPALLGPLAVNDHITNATIIGEDELQGAEDIAPGLDGHLYTGTADGGIWRISMNSKGEARRVKRVATVAGRPLGLDAYSRHILIAAVARQGVMAIDTRTGETWVLTDRLDGRLIFFPDAVSVATDGTIYFTEASTVYLPGFPNDLLDGRPNGRLLRYEPTTGVTDVVADGLYFANGVQVDPDEHYVLVAESFRTRLTRVWLRGSREGTTEQFGPWLVNGPDNIRLDDRGRVWIGGSDLRSDEVDAVFSSEAARRALAAIPPDQLGSVRRPYGFAMVLDRHGSPIFSFHDTTGRFHSVSSVLPHGRTITFGSLTDRGVAQVPMPAELTR
ncbi:MULTISPECIES: SMP-30/gluconolactonase/LRE family protein [unclassified Kribbella]|uniref:SMP-30/gluconolactonase/LRE family protein n=1 Tax=unclassified Kribbella TaxID=2644121 RepID=UPI0033EF1461